MKNSADYIGKPSGNLSKLGAIITLAMSTLLSSLAHSSDANTIELNPSIPKKLALSKPMLELNCEDLKVINDAPHGTILSLVYLIWFEGYYTGLHGRLPPLISKEKQTPSLYTASQDCLQNGGNTNVFESYKNWMKQTGVEFFRSAYFAAGNVNDTANKLDTDAATSVAAKLSCSDLMNAKIVNQNDRPIHGQEKYDRPMLAYWVVTLPFWYDGYNTGQTGQPRVSNRILNQSFDAKFILITYTIFRTFI